MNQRVYQPLNDEQGNPPPGDDFEDCTTGCKCGPEVEASNYKNQIWVHAPSHMPKENGYCLDRCIAEEIMQLWMKGITTLGCCCGHRDTVPAYIQVINSDKLKMQEIGYVSYENKFGNIVFRPKFN
jgi:hypothetical protein